MLLLSKSLFSAQCHQKAQCFYQDMQKHNHSASHMAKCSNHTTTYSHNLIVIIGRDSSACLRVLITSEFEKTWIQWKLQTLQIKFLLMLMFINLINRTNTLYSFSTMSCWRLTSEANVEVQHYPCEFMISFVWSLGHIN